MKLKILFHTPHQITPQIFKNRLDNELEKGNINKSYYDLMIEESGYNEFDIYMMKKPWINQMFSYQVYYAQDENNILNVLFEKYGSDKGSAQGTSEVFEWIPHSYAEYYDRLFRSRRKSVQNFFECGIGTTNLSISCNMGKNGQPGASLRVWRDYFENAKIHGADIDQSILLSESKIQTYYVDQLDSKSIKKMWEQVGDQKMDIILDDGLHSFDGGRILFENSFDQLNSSGLYIIEDVDPKTFNEFMEYFKNNKNRVDFVSLNRCRDEYYSNNKIIVIYK